MDFAEFSRFSHGYEKTLANTAKVETATLVSIGEVAAGETDAHVSVVQVDKDYHVHTVGTGDTAKDEDRRPVLSVTTAKDASPVRFERPDQRGNPQRHDGVAVFAGKPLEQYVYVDPNALGQPVLAPGPANEVQ